MTQEEVARAALAEISPAGTVGDLLDSTAQDDGTATLRFVSTLPGYPGWHWSVSVAEIAGEAPTVMEAELMPGEGALLAPDWVPWAERLEDYRAAQALIAAEGAVDDLDDDDLADERDEDDDLGDDPDDGIDFEDDDLLGVPLGGVDEEDEAEAESDDDGPEQPDET
ncbi:DUF3027 domain-containing protein [Pseudolysinimonas yzui]|uniref:DUF3027 domain-containing protein n=1 Tax=Pseudolysinimonas yzui TaxID=2708254 RepID=A0A8J3GSN1_9MICO|nr:DUF3027 domain-containing protein [Pseudolysinimonas yzui]GHF23783.1 hypothetical protein GCM10011600_26180 [Pseudolysinimonas yzui]